MSTISIPVEVHPNGSYTQLSDRMSVSFRAIEESDLPPVKPVSRTVRWDEVFVSPKLDTTTDTNADLPVEDTTSNADDTAANADDTTSNANANANANEIAAVYPVFQFQPKTQSQHKSLRHRVSAGSRRGLTRRL